MVAAETLVKLGPPRSDTDAKKKIVAAIDAAAARLNNTRAVCRKSYVNPRVPESYPDGTWTAHSGGPEGGTGSPVRSPQWSLW